MESTSDKPTCVSATPGRSGSRGRGGERLRARPRCRACHKFGHRTQDCWNNLWQEPEPGHLLLPELRTRLKVLGLCFICGRNGHRAEDCPERTVLPIWGGILFCSSESPRAYVNAEFHGRPLRCMLDMGCDRSVIGRHLLTDEIYRHPDTP